MIAAIVSLMRGSSKPPAETGAAVTPAAEVPVLTPSAAHIPQEHNPCR